MRLSARLAGAGPAILVRVEAVKGSAPREAGTVMAVTPDALFGTIGGGQFEWLAIDHARALMAGKRDDTELDIPLGADIGQCCGGRVVLSFKPVTDDVLRELAAEEDAEERTWPEVHIFGAGHVGRALAVALRPLPVRAIVYDARAAELARLAPGIETRQTALPEAGIRAAGPESAFVVLTHDHALDFMIAKEALMRGDAAYVGLIGSKTKRAAFKSWLVREGGLDADMARLTCPIGGTAVADKRPAVIAALTAAEIVAALGAKGAALGEKGKRNRAALD